MTVAFSECRYIKELPIIDINLDLPPEQRWNHLRLNTEIVDEIRLHAEELGIYSRNIWPRALIRFVFFLVRWLILPLFSFSGDIFALARLYAIHPSELFLANIIYEISGGCTSFVCTDRSDLHQRPIHARSMDWPFRPLAKHSVQFRWYKGGHIIFHSVGWIGQVGIMTGVKPGAFSISLNARYPHDNPSKLAKFLLKTRCLFFSNFEDDLLDIELLVTGGIARLTSALTFHAWTVGSIIRESLETSNSFEDVVNLISRSRLSAPGYFIIAGSRSGEGAVVTRGTHPTDSKILRMDLSSNSVVQTNVDVPISRRDRETRGHMDAVERFDSVSQALSHRRNRGLSPTEAGSVLGTSANKERGVRMGMTLYMCVMKPFEVGEGCMDAVFATRPIGPQ